MTVTQRMVMNGVLKLPKVCMIVFAPLPGFDEVLSSLFFG